MNPDADSEADNESDGHGLDVQVQLDLLAARDALSKLTREKRPYSTVKRRNPEKVEEKVKEDEKVFKDRKVRREESRLAMAVREEERLPRLKDSKKLAKLAVPITNTPLPLCTKLNIRTPRKSSSLHG